MQILKQRKKHNIYPALKSKTKLFPKTIQTLFTAPDTTIVLPNMPTEVGMPTDCNEPRYCLTEGMISGTSGTGQPARKWRRDIKDTLGVLMKRKLICKM